MVAKTGLDRSHSVGKEGYHTQLPAAEVGKEVDLDMDMDTAVRLEVVVVRMVPHLAVEEEGGSFKLPMRTLLRLTAEEILNSGRVR